MRNSRRIPWSIKAIHSHGNPEDVVKRVLLFVATNLAIVVVLGVVLNVILPALGIRVGGQGALLVFAFVLGMGGAFISLAISKWLALRSTGARVIERPRNRTEQWLLETVRRQAKQAGIGMPDVAIYASPEPNAFATGMKRNDALVAVSTGLLEAMRAEEAEAVLGHEVSHIANGDMVTMTLLQGVLNTFVIFLARIIANAISGFLGRGEQGGGLGFLGYFAVVIVAEIVLGILASIIVMAFSRYREFRADAGGARLAGRERMIAALQRLKSAHEPSHLPDQLAAFGINGGGRMGRLFMSHPPIDERIAALSRGH